MYDFTTRVERRNSTSIKWKLIEDDMGEGNDDVIAMSVADMEFNHCATRAAPLPPM